MKKYQVIGGQYESKWYGESDSLRGAKCIATRHQEFCTFRTIKAAAAFIETTF